jgi:hypothetical protein
VRPGGIVPERARKGREMGEKDTYAQSDEARDWEFVRLVEEIREKEREYDIDLTDWFVAEAEARGYCREL